MIKYILLPNPRFLPTFIYEWIIRKLLITEKDFEIRELYCKFLGREVPGFVNDVVVNSEKNKKLLIKELKKFRKKVKNAKMRVL